MPRPWVQSSEHCFLSDLCKCLPMPPLVPLVVSHSVLTSVCQKARKWRALGNQAVTVVTCSWSVRMCPQGSHHSQDKWEWLDQPTCQRKGRGSQILKAFGLMSKGLASISKSLPCSVERPLIWDTKAGAFPSCDRTMVLTVKGWSWVAVE